MSKQQTMGDRELMEDLLLTSKQLATLYNDAVIEAANDEFFNQFKDNLNETLLIQHEIYLKMQEKGWYSMENAEKKKIDKVKKKFSAN